MENCPYCQNTALVKDGFNPSGSQRYTCKVCKRTHTPAPKPNGYAADLRAQAVRLYLQGLGLRAIGRILKVNSQSVANWVRRTAANVEETPPQPATANVIEMDELYTFAGTKKTNSM